MKSLLIILSACLIAQACTLTNSENTALTFGAVFFSDESKIEAYFNPGLLVETESLDSGWIFLGKDSIPGIDRDVPNFENSEAINLPHRLPFANHSFWYKTRVNLAPGVLVIDADDGAQLWVNEKRIPKSERGVFFEILDSGEKDLLIRVVNNAMAGGLRKVTWISQADFLNVEKSKNAIRNSILLKRKAALAQDPGISSKLAKSDAPEKKSILDDYPILITEPLMILGTDGKYFLRWVSEKPGLAKLTFSDGIQKEIKSENGVFTYEPAANELQFSLVQEKSNFGDFYFSIPNPDSNLKIALWGDSQGAWDIFHQIALQIQTHHPDLSIGAGDLVNNGSDEMAYPRFLQKLSLMKTPQLLVPGNHDYDGFYENLKPDLMNKFLFRESDRTYGMQVFGPIAVITLDPNEFFPVSIPSETPQRIWFDEAIESDAWKTSTWKMIVLHQPPYSQGWPDYHGEKSVQDLLKPYFHRGLVDLVVAGHTHDYERLKSDFSGNAVTFLVVGGAGGGLEPEGDQSEFPLMDKVIKQHHFGILEVNKEELNWKVFGLDGELLDRFSITKRN
ncbi:MAG: metallophosphoesterase [Algoriphagus sp.]|uniref:metallophosphoesterase family protein n=2 Tax=Algoriphagus sp. TaxID=1872435 RepID=UPI00273230B5|nr:metallophosphoesterase [Algoriphagus sp.]MDP3472709.1 metallophosphoesterase [Algoriphagus sp.]